MSNISAAFTLHSEAGEGSGSDHGSLWAMGLTSAICNPEHL